MIADASREAMVTTTWEYDYQLLRMSYSESWLHVQPYLQESQNDFEAMIIAPTLSEAIQGSFWEHYERMNRASEALRLCERQLEISN